MHPLLKPYNLFYSNGVAILSGFQDIPQTISVGFTDVIIQVKVLGQLQIKVQKPEKAQLGTLENKDVQDDCEWPSTIRELLRKRSVRQNV